MTPNRFGGKEELWRDWLEEVRGYIESARPGMKFLLLAVEKKQGPVDKTWVSQQNPLLARDSELLWRVLKALTEDGSGPRMVVMTVGNEDGFVAWTKLNSLDGQALRPDKEPF